jgi:hypothetical protein
MIAFDRFPWLHVSLTRVSDRELSASPAFKGLTEVNYN